ncbi:MAG TPA: DUF5680 domain-containing protein [Desulfosporosinus sp.]|nr:DUF5680 domain-containing protein [Desulfosporosinus sp.]
MIDERELINVLLNGRLECCMKNRKASNSYQTGKIYDWEIELFVGKYIYNVSHRGTNPYSGVEYVFEEGNPLPIWSCDYVGYAKLKRPSMEKEFYGFLKKGRKMSLKDRQVTFFTFGFDEGYFSYQSRFTGSFVSGLLQIEEIYYQGDLVVQQITGGHLNIRDNAAQ